VTINLKEIFESHQKNGWMDITNKNGQNSTT